MAPGVVRRNAVRDAAAAAAADDEEDEDEDDKEKDEEEEEEEEEDFGDDDEDSAKETVCRSALKLRRARVLPRCEVSSQRGTRLCPRISRYGMS